MYQITRKNKIVEQLQLCHADGSVALVVDVEINVDQTAGKINKAKELLAMAQGALQKNPESPELMEAYGKAVVSLFNSIFGEEDTEKIIAFYDGNYSEMLIDIFPFLYNEIIPKINEASAERKEQLLQAAKLAKSGKR